MSKATMWVVLAFVVFFVGLPAALASGIACTLVFGSWWGLAIATVDGGFAALVVIGCIECAERARLTERDAPRG